MAATGSPLKTDRRIDRAAAIRDNLVTAILEHRLQPGTKLGEDELGDIFGSSRTLVRAALQSLAHEGIVVIEKNRGAFVARPTPAEAREVFEARRLVEPAIAARAAERADDGTARMLEAHIAEERAAVGRGDERAAIRLSGDFHMLVARVAAHGIYETILRELIARSSLTILLYRSSRVHLCGTDHHRVIADAILAGDSALAGRLMIEHLNEIEHGLDLEEDATATPVLRDILAGPFDGAGADRASSTA